MGSRLLLGRVVKLSKVGLEEKGVAQVRVKHNVFDHFLKMYFGKSTDFWAFDKETSVKLGDHVLIREMKEPLTRKVTFQVERLVFNHGDILDPASKRKVADPYSYQDHVDWKSKFVDKWLSQHGTTKP